jgi:arsenate reductase
MANWTIIHNPRCSKSRASLEKLESASVNLTVREYLNSPLSKSELSDVLNKLNLPVSKIVRTKEELFKQDPFDLEDQDLVLSKLEQMPKLLERPIIIKDDKAVIGRPPENIDELL